MNRYNIFYQVHKGLRALLYETNLQLQQTDFTQTEEAEQAIERLQLVIKLFEDHAHKEDTIVFPAIEDYEPSIVDLFAKEHVEDLALGEKLKKLLSAFSNATSANEQTQTGQAIVKAFEEFTVFNMKHMNKEETIINEKLWRYYTDDELYQMTLRIISKVEPAMSVHINKWMLHGLNNNEIQRWFRQVKNTAPSVAFQSLLKIAEAELPRNRWYHLQESLSEGAMVA